MSVNRLRFLAGWLAFWLLLGSAFGCAPAAPTAPPAKILPPAAAGQTPAPAANAVADPATLLSGFEDLVAEAMAEFEVPGLAVAVVKGAEVIYARGFGLRDVGRGLPVTPHTIFGIGSCSKAFTATATGILVDEGKLDWDKPVRTYLPDFTLADDVASEHVTTRDLLSHRTGLPRHDHVWIRSPYNRQEMYDGLRHLELSRDIRQVYQYNNLMVMTAGYLVGSIAGMPWESFVRQRILEPLGMAETNFSTDDSQKSADFSCSYTMVGGRVLEFPFYNADALGPAGSINSSALDMARWVALNLNKGLTAGTPGRRLISERRLAQIHSPQVVVPEELKHPELFYPTYGMGWRINAYRGHPFVSHGGAIMGYSAMVAMLPRDDIGLVLLNNLEDAPLNSILAYNVFDRLLGLEPVDWFGRVKADIAESKAKREKAAAEKDKDRKPGTSPSHPLEAYCGSYEHPTYGTIPVRLEDGVLKADYHQRTLEFEHYHYDVFRMKNDFMGADYKVVFELDIAGNVCSLKVPFEPSVPAIVFVRKAS